MRALRKNTAPAIAARAGTTAAIARPMASLSPSGAKPCEAAAHFAYTTTFSVTALPKSMGRVHALSVYHPPNAHPGAVGAGGSSALSPAFTDCAGGATPWPVETNET